MNHRSKVADSHYFLRSVVAELLAGYSNVSSTLSSRALSQSISFSHSYWKNIFILIAASVIISSGSYINAKVVKTFGFVFAGSRVSKFFVEIDSLLVFVFK